MRSLLFVPGVSQRKLEKAIGSQSDVLIADLEDSVSLDSKAEARRITAAFLQSARSRTNAQLYVRVNDLATGLTEDDLAVVMRARPDGIMLPKAEGGNDVARLAAALRVHEAENGIEDGRTRILPIITETALGVLNAASYRGSSDRLAGLTWGAEDLSAHIGALAARHEDGSYTPLFQLARNMTLLAAAAAGVPAIDTVFPNFSDTEAFARDCQLAVRDGFVARMAIHPVQVDTINTVFTPSDEEVEKARAVVEAFSAAGNAGVVNIGGRMYDRPHLALAERVLARAAEASSA
ncbi:citrate lyase subunit beta / citryl-CoA lyase [Nitratireductor aquibiodomus]|uniref:Citrate lyase subunit beta / citryl-CoA lyase n=1 Tax=Nitratireductor aquibiodomus TaxID=204799 RepID=A0A1H4IVM4_9HYPH|nr:CoA ester lyase [Nitratireductor aquibiodomus]SEB38150.1 citrate lyase subunit beta / citryl-CoA lyase [Nitratireductor aquibiodomus]